MKIFGLCILKQKTLEEQLEKVRKQATKKAVVIPNKMISKLLWQIYGKHRKSLIQAYQESQMRLREKVLNGCQTKKNIC